MSGKSRNSRRKLESELEGLCISLHKFLVLYYGISDEVVSKIDMISHKDASILIPSIMTYDVYNYTNIEDLYIGGVIAVIDSYGKIELYIPPRNNDLVPFCDYDYKEIVNKENFRLENLLINENLSKYDLVLLCRYYRKNNRIKEYRIANKLLKEKVLSIKKYKKKKIELIMRGREEDD